MAAAAAAAATGTRKRKSSTHGDRDRAFDSDNPPNSRLFIVCDKVSSEDQFRQVFGRYGEVVDVRVLNDRVTGEPKGIVYVQFAKTSQAAEALENLHGVTLENHSRPLKVLVASNKAEGCKRESNETERLLRLFIVVPKDATEEKLREYFNEFGEVNDVLVLKDKKTGDNKGFAYIRYEKASHAARAFENCDKSYRPVFAEPKNSSLSIRDRDRDRDRDRNRYVGSSGRPPTWSINRSSSSRQLPSLVGNHGQSRTNNDDYPIIRPLFENSGGGDVVGSLQRSSSFCSLHVIASSGLSQQQLWKLFDIIPGLESCNLHMRNCDYEDDPVYATVKYCNPQSAAQAVTKLNNFEYPPGYPLCVTERWESDGPNGTNGRNYASSSSMSLPIGYSEIEKLTNALAHAQSIIKAAGLSSPNFERRETNNSIDCSIQLPSPKPFAPAGATAQKRLFIVCTPTLLPRYILRDVFSRFEGLLDIYMLPGKACGYIKYSLEESADKAISLLHGQEVEGIRLKVMLADPRDSELATDRKKRQRTRE